MRIIIITQDEPFYLSKNLDYLFQILPPDVLVVGSIVTNVSPFGKRESFIQKAIKTLKIFGFNFFLFYALKFIYSKLNNSNSVFRVLKKNNIPLINILGSINSKSSLKKIKEFKPDLLVSILGNQIFKSELINLAKKGCINLHTALLPKYRGLMPTFWVLKNNEKETGVSVFFVDEGIDSGPIIVQKKVLIENKSQSELIRLTKKIGMEAISEAVKLIYSGKVNLIKNDKSKMTYFSFPTRKDVIEFRKQGKTFF